LSAFCLGLSITVLFILMSPFVAPIHGADSLNAPRNENISASTTADPGAPLLTVTDSLAASAERNADQELQRDDVALMQAIAANDAVAASSLLAPEFAWIDRDGRSRRKSELMGRLILLEAGPDTSVTVEHYGRLAIVTGRHRLSPDDATAFFVRVWIDQPSGWRLFLYQETAPTDFSATDTRYSLPHGEWRICENPCRELPFKALSSDAQEIVASFMAGEQAVFDSDTQTAARILADDFFLVTPERAQPMDKAQRIAAMRRALSTTLMIPPPTVVSMALRVFGSAAVMSADEISASGEKLRATRVWARRDGQWQLAFSQQTLVQ
jgi:hypothetical protein